MYTQTQAMKTKRYLSWYNEPSLPGEVVAQASRAGREDEAQYAAVVVAHSIPRYTRSRVLISRKIRVWTFVLLGPESMP